MLKFYSVLKDEKETISAVDYASRKLSIYSTRPATMKKLIKILGDPKIMSHRDGKVDSMEWDISFDNRTNIKKALSLGVLLPPTK